MAGAGAQAELAAAEAQLRGMEQAAAEQAAIEGERAARLAALQGAVAQAQADAAAQRSKVPACLLSY